MRPKTMTAAALLGGLAAGTLLGLAAMRLTPPIKAAPAPLAAAPAPGTVADLYAGKTYPLALKAEQIGPTYHLVFLVDGQGKPSQYATRGETAQAGGETFLVCYDVPVTNAQSHPAQPKAGSVGQLIFVNLRAVQAMGGIVPIQPADAPAPAPAPL